MGKNWKQRQILFSWSLKSLWMMTAAMKLKKQKTKKQKTKKQHLLLRKKAVINLVSILKKQKHHFANKGPYSQSYVLSSNHVCMWELDHKEGWGLKNWWFQTVVLEKALESPLDSKKIKPVNPEGNQPWIFIGRTVAEAEAPVLWPPVVKSQLIGKDLDGGKDWGQEEKKETEDAMVGWHHQLNGHEFELTLGNSEGHGDLACCSPWGHKEPDMTEQLNNNNNNTHN